MAWGTVVTLPEVPPPGLLTDDREGPRTPGEGQTEEPPAPVPGQGEWW